MDGYGSNRVVEKIMKSAEREKHLHAFVGVDRKALMRMDDKQLAEWQSDYPNESPQFLLADHEWQRRLTAQQIGAVKFAAWLSIVGVVIGAILGAGLTYLIGKNSQVQSNATVLGQPQAIEKIEQKNTEEMGWKKDTVLGKK